MSTLFLYIMGITVLSIILATIGDAYIEYTERKYENEIESNKRR